MLSEQITDEAGTTYERRPCIWSEWEGGGGNAEEKTTFRHPVQIFVQRSWTRPQLPPNISHVHEAVVFTATRISTGKSASSLNLQCS